MKIEKAVRNIDAFNIPGIKGTMFSRSEETSNMRADFISLQYEGRLYYRGAFDHLTKIYEASGKKKNKKT